MSEEKKAFAVRQDADGKINVLAAVSGDSAEKLIETAACAGVEIVNDANLAKEVERQTEGEVTADLVWDELSVLIAEIEGFVEELDGLWTSEKSI